MTRYEHRCVPAPRRVKRRRGEKTPAEALARAVAEVLDAQAAEGWEYLRADLMPLETRQGLFSAVVETHQSVMVFRRAVATAAPQQPAAPQTQRPADAGPLMPEFPSLGAARRD